MDKRWLIKLVDCFSYAEDSKPTRGRAAGNFVVGKGSFWDVERQAVSLGLDPMALDAEIFTSSGEPEEIVVRFDVVAGGVSGSHQDPTFSFGTDPSISESLRSQLPQGVYVRFKDLSD